MAMTVLRPGDPVAAAGRAAVTVGVYDGVHAGHRWLLRRLRRVAGEQSLRVTVVTFDPHPLRVLRPVSAPRMLTDLDTRLRLFAETGLVDECLVIPFDEARARQSPEEFVREVLVGQVRAATVMVGEDFRFGHNRSGDVAELRRLGDEYGFCVLGLPLLPARAITAGTACSSTHIRRLITHGEIARAAGLLGRPHEVSGLVVGTSRPTAGRGTPTVVVRVDPDLVLPTEGAYAGSIITPDGRERAAGVSVRQGMVSGPALLDVHVVSGIPALIEARVRVRLARRVWTSGRAELVAEMARADEEAGWSTAAGGWAAMR